MKTWSTYQFFGLSYVTTQQKSLQLKIVKPDVFQSVPAAKHTLAKT